MGCALWCSNDSSKDSGRCKDSTGLVLKVIKALRMAIVKTWVYLQKLPAGSYGCADSEIDAVEVRPAV